MTIPTKDEIRDAASQVAFGEPLVQNNLRGLVVEVIVDHALKLDWLRCARDWKGWDFEHGTDHTRLEVKQSARRQTWAPPKSPEAPRFDIAARAGYWEGAEWTANVGRHAHIYVFGLHSTVDESADHRDANQWCFYVVPTLKLPVTKTNREPTLKTLSAAHTWEQLYDAVERERIALRSSDQHSA
jgi:hypothetical protein